MAHEKVQKHITELITRVGLPETDVVITYDEKMNTLWFSVTGPSTRVLFNRDGEVLSALNHVAGRIAEQLTRSEDTHPRVVIDANDFEKKKIDSLKTLAHMMAERARYFKSSIDIDPMNAHDRKIIHEYLSDALDIKTESEGDGPKRHVVIRYVDQKV